MADVQLSGGHIRIANALFRAAMLAKLSPVEQRALMECVWRQYGWADPKAPPVPFELAGSALSQAVGGSRSTASQAITALVDHNILVQYGEAGDRGRRSFLLQKDFTLWTCGFHRNPSRVHWTPAAGEVSPFQNASVLKPERKRPETRTHTMPEAQPLKASSDRLEPIRTKENQESATAGARTWPQEPMDRIAELRRRLGARIVIDGDQRAKWLGIASLPVEAVDEIAQFAISKGAYPVSSFLGCFSDDGLTITAQKPQKAKKAPRRGARPYTQQEDDPRYFKPGEDVQTPESLKYFEELRAKQAKEAGR